MKLGADARDGVGGLLEYFGRAVMIGKYQQTLFIKKIVKTENRSGLVTSIARSSSQFPIRCPSLDVFVLDCSQKTKSLGILLLFLVNEMVQVRHKFTAGIKLDFQLVYLGRIFKIHISECTWGNMITFINGVRFNSTGALSWATLAEVVSIVPVAAG